ncbi:MAG: hypothetical protein M1392_04395 [Gammaproteobacteria bacterium]|nr:hypothetical protein [Gammaproteobacteria bacterium]
MKTLFSRPDPWVIILGLLCAAGAARADTFVSGAVIKNPAPARFSVCYEHTCSKVAQLALPERQWQSVRALFNPAPQDAQAEREVIARAVAQMERLVGPLTGTAHDKGRNFKGVGIAGQMDCIDESTNTTTYLAMMAHDGLLQWHTVEDRVTRGFFIFGWPHTTAVICDITDSQRYAVDSWFRDNGEEPYILPLEIWRGGWQPES